MFIELLYVNKSPLLTVVIETSIKSSNLVEIIVPPPPEPPPTFLKIPLGKIKYDDESVNKASFLKTIEPKKTAFCFVLSIS